MHIEPLFLRIQTYSSNFLIKLLLKIVFLLRIISTKYQHLLKIYSLSADSDTHNTRWSNLGCLKIPHHKTKIYGRRSANISAIYTWNYLPSNNNITSLTMANSLLSCMYIFVFCFFLFVHFLLLSRLIQHSTCKKSKY